MRVNSLTCEVNVVTKTGRYLGAAVLNRTRRDTASLRGSGAMTDSRATELNSMVRHPMAEALAWAVAILSAITAVAGLFWSTLYRDAPFWIQQARGIDLRRCFSRFRSLSSVCCYSTEVGPRQCRL
jgi:hypothetical protein